MTAANYTIGPPPEPPEFTTGTPGSSGVRKAIAKLLDQLGDTPAKVAAKLLEGGHKGRQGWSRECPVSKYLAAAYGPGQIIVWTQRCVHVDSGTTVRLPQPVQDFINGFDNADMYEELRLGAMEL